MMLLEVQKAMQFPSLKQKCLFPVLVSNENVKGMTFGFALGEYMGKRG